MREPLLTAACDSRCATFCSCSSKGLGSVPQDLPMAIISLDLQENGISVLSQSDFSRYTKLQHLILKTNKIANIRSGQFLSLPDLKTLSLYHNKITSIPPGAFSGLPQLQTLYLFFNKITTIQSDAFVGLAQLNCLYLFSNDISNIQYDAFSHLPQLKQLYLYNNKITNIQPGILSNLSQLKDLDLSRNQMTGIMTGVFSNLAKLQNLNLNSNQITEIESGTFLGLPKLKILALSNNSITNIYPGALSAFSDLHKLINLDLSYNQIRNIQSGAFSGLSRLERLSLSFNRIVDVQIGSFFHFNQLQRLSLDNNLMKVVPSYNELSSIPRVDLYNNSWQCDCRMAPFKQNISESRSLVKQILCEGPGKFVGQKLEFINPADLVVCKEPKIVSFEQVERNTFEQGETSVLVCRASGIPTPYITIILPSGRNVTPDSDGRLTVDAKDAAFTREVTASNAGLYVCVASNFVGVASVTLPLGFRSPASVSPKSTSTALLTFSPPRNTKSSNDLILYPLPVLIGIAAGIFGSPLLIYCFIYFFIIRNSNLKGHSPAANNGSTDGRVNTVSSDLASGQHINVYENDDDVEMSGNILAGIDTNIYENDDEEEISGNNLAGIDTIIYENDDEEEISGNILAGIDTIIYEDDDEIKMVANAEDGINTDIYKNDEDVVISSNADDTNTYTDDDEVEISTNAVARVDTIINQTYNEPGIAATPEAIPDNSDDRQNDETFMYDREHEKASVTSRLIYKN
ncbi:uncharacterized protein LOC144880549 [Branchiostoma floridae x Branchiostoma japonicum]